MRGKRKLKVHWVNGVEGREEIKKKTKQPHQMAWEKRRKEEKKKRRKEECRKGREVIKPNQPNNYKTTPPPKRMEARDGL